MQRETQSAIMFAPAGLCRLWVLLLPALDRAGGAAIVNAGEPARRKRAAPEP
jgi:hypothetical protein